LVCNIAGIQIITDLKVSLYIEASKVSNNNKEEK